MNFRKLLSIVIGLNLSFNALAGNEPEIIEDENGDPIGIKLNLPEELIKDCENKFWTLKDETTKTELDNILSSQENFDEWCQKQTEIDNRNPVKLRNLLCKYAYILRGANEKSYTLEGVFCKRVELGKILGGIHLKGATPCCCYYTEAELYVKELKLTLLDCF